MITGMTEVSMRSHKKGSSVWISWVLLMVFMIITATAVFNWMKSFSEERVADVKERIYDTNSCESVSLYLKTLNVNPQSLNIRLSNNNLLKVDALIVRVYSSNNTIQIYEHELTIKPNEEKSFVLAINATSVSQVQIVPIVREDENEVVCRDRLVEYNV